MSRTIQAYATFEKGKPLTPFSYEAGELGDEEIEIAVSHCGICHSDLSMIDNEWGNAVYPLVAGHEISGTITAVGAHAKRAKVGQRVGLGWVSESCMSCPQCLSGDHNLCPTSESTIVQRHGGFASHVRCHWAWANEIPEGLDPAKAGPLFCGGITVFNPIVQFGIRPTDRVGVIGIGGLGHLAVQFLYKWGCEVTAFTTSDSKRQEATELGAHHVVNSKEPEELKKLTGKFDFILSTVNASLDWPAYLNALAPKGRLHTVGVVLKPVALPVFPMIGGQKSFSGSPLGSPATTARMLEFCARHEIEPTTEFYKMSEVNEALQHLRDGKARYRIVLENDFKE